MPSEPQSPAPKRVAVIAVHGVGSPPARQTARAVTELLMQGAAAVPRYRWFEERSVIIPVAPVGIDVIPPPSVAGTTGAPESHADARTPAPSARRATQPAASAPDVVAPAPAPAAVKTTRTAALVLDAKRAFTENAGDRTHFALPDDGQSSKANEPTVMSRAVQAQQSATSVDTKPVAPSTFAPAPAPAPAAPPATAVVDVDVAFQQASAIDEAAYRADIAFTRELLQGYESRGIPYETIETVGVRHGANGNTDVHVFEMHWADLSRIGTGPFSFFGATYQLIQHISQLGRKTLDVAAQVAKARELRRESSTGSASYASWARYSWMHAWVIRCFTVLIPVTAIVMTAFAALFIPGVFNESGQLAVGVAACAVIAIIGGALAIYFGPADRKSASIFVGYMLAVFVVAAGVLLWRWPTRAHSAFGTGAITTAVVVLTLLALYATFRSYNRTRSGALLFGSVATYTVTRETITLGRASLGGVGLAPAEYVRQLGLIGLQEGYTLLMTMWVLLWGAVFLTMFLRMDVVRQTRGLERVRASRSAFTARVTLAFSAFSFIVCALVFYRALLYLAERGADSFSILPRANRYGMLPTVHMPVVMPSDHPCFGDRTQACAAQLIDELIGRSGTSGFVIAVLGLAVVLVLMSWLIALIAATTIRQPDPTKGNGRRLGLWMTDGFRWARGAGTAMALTMFIAVLVGLLLGTVPHLQYWLKTHAPSLIARTMDPTWTSAAVTTLTVAALASAASIGAARIRVATLASKARPTIGVALDVDHYLRETPSESTPRAQMFERYVSLLRYIERQGSFDRVVIVAHSQGTIISTDLLRYLDLGVTGADHELVSPERFRLMTFGCPLRQVYGAHFPYLYSWVNESDGGDLSAPVPPPNVKPDLSARTPDPDALRVGRWVNLYTSGDYIGRNLWTPDRWENVWDLCAKTAELKGGARRERCLGAGTHTFYWTNPELAAELDDLIAG